MDKHPRCPHCHSFIPKQFVTHTGGSCKRCGQHIEPEWYRWMLENRPFGSDALPMQPWDSMVEIRPHELDLRGLYTVIEYHMGITIPWDISKIYWPPFSEGEEYGDIDITPENAMQIAGMEGVDVMHNALLIICGALVGPSNSTRENAIVAANLIYYLATRMVVGGNIPKELKLEREIRERDFPLLQDAVAFLFDRCGLIHTASTDYHRFYHPHFF